MKAAGGRGVSMEPAGERLGAHRVPIGGPAWSLLGVPHGAQWGHMEPAGGHMEPLGVPDGACWASYTVNTSGPTGGPAWNLLMVPYGASWGSLWSCMET